MVFDIMEFPEVFNGADRLVDWNVREGRGDKAAIYYFDEIITYKQIQDNVNRTGNALKSLGIEVENRIAVMTLDCPQFIYSTFGAQKLGAVPVGLNTMLSQKDYLYMLNDSRAKALIISNELYPVIAEIKSELRFLKNIIVVADMMDGTKAGPIDGTIDFNSWVAGFPT